MTNTPKHLVGRSCDLRFSLDSSYDLHRGFKSLLPRRINKPKLLTSSLLGCLDSDDHSNQVISLDSLSDKERVYLSDLIRAHYKIQNYPADLWSVVDSISEIENPFYLLLAESDIFFDHRWRTLRQTQCRLYPDESYQYFMESSENWSWNIQGSSKLYEEYPGKLRVLDLETKTKELWTKKIRAEKKKSNQEKTEYNLDHLCEEGWSIGCFRVNFAKKNTHRLIGETLSLPDAALGLGFGEQVSLIVQEWLTKAKVRKDFSGVCLMGVFDIALSSALAQSFLRHQLCPNLEKIISTDLQYGLAPIATVLEALSIYDNFIYVGMDAYPSMNIFYGSKENEL